MKDWINSYIHFLSFHSPFTNTYGVARSLLALSLLSTLLANDTAFIFSNTTGEPLCFGGLQSLSIYCLLGKEHILLAKWLSVFVLILVVWGIYPRITGIFHWWVSFSFFVSCPYIDGGDQVCSILSLLLLPVTLLDNRKSHWISTTKNKPWQCLVANITLRVIRIQVAIIYFHATVAKLGVKEWVDSTVIYYWFTHNNFGLNEFISPFIIPLFSNNIIVTSVTWSVLLVELCLFGALFGNAKFRKLMLIVGFAFHGMIFFIHGLGSFALAMFGALILYLYPVHQPMRILPKNKVVLTTA